MRRVITESYSTNTDNNTVIYDVASVRVLDKSLRGTQEESTEDMADKALCKEELNSRYTRKHNANRMAMDQDKCKWTECDNAATHAERVQQKVRESVDY